MPIRAGKGKGVAVGGGGGAGREIRDWAGKRWKRGNGLVEGEEAGDCPSHPLRFSESPAIVPARSFPIAESGADHSFPIVPTYPFPTPSLLVPTLLANSPSPPRQPPSSLEPAVAAGAAVDRGGADGAAGGMNAAGSLTAGGFRVRPGGDADEVGSECAASSLPGGREHTLSFTAGLGGWGGGRERVTGLGRKG